MSSNHQPIVPARVRRIDGSFAFVPHRFLRDGFLRSLTNAELRLYVMLILVADRDGISFYSNRRLCSELDMSPDTYLAAHEGLLRKDLIAVCGVRVQVLSLPAQPVLPAATVLNRDQKLSACQAILATLASARMSR